MLHGHMPGHEHVAPSGFFYKDYAKPNIAGTERLGSISGNLLYSFPMNLQARIMNLEPDLKEIVVSELGAMTSLS